MELPSNHLRACEEHGIVADHNESCPSCETGVTAMPENVVDDVNQTDLRLKIEPDTMIELVTLMEEYLADNGKDSGWIEIAHLDKNLLPAGYTVQERWFNVFAYNWGAMEKHIIREQAAVETIEALKDNGYGSSEDVD